MRDHPRFLMNSRWWLIGAVVFGSWGYALVAQAAGSSENGSWTRHVRAGGESWIYRFTVADGAGATASIYSGAPAGGGEARRLAARRRDPAGSDASVRQPSAASPAGNGGGAGNGVDIAVERAYTKTAIGGQGTEVTAPAAGQTVYFYVDYSLTGTTGIYIISRRAVFDGQDFCHTTENTSAGSYFAWCTTGWTATAGDHTLRWDFDYNNQLTENNEANNSATAMWTSQQTEQVDLEAQRAYLQTAAGGDGSEVTTPAVGQTVYFYVDFRIVGTGDAIVDDRRAVFDDQTFCTSTGTSPPGDYYAWCTDGWTATAGSHTLRWDFDFDNKLSETNENNNSASAMWTSPSGSVDLEAERAYLNTMTAGEGDEVTTPAVGQAVYFHLDYSLIGSGGAIAVDRRAVFDGQTFCSFTGMPTPGDYLTWCVDPWTATAGSHTLRWDLDYNNTVSETNENNNSASTTWTSGAGTCSGDCDSDGVVTVSELITMVDDVLGNTLVCGAGDTDKDGKIRINEVVAGVNRALNGCG
ncbi:MAG TPA: CARDB domain-containing protein [Candidatus Margulisiibacteriota bacterium]|nr:CARDB domain-containing protein [Candidatus Margulisiibacteriota bacterium]